MRLPSSSIIYARNIATVKCAAFYILHCTYAWPHYTFTVRTLHLWCVSTPHSCSISHSLTVWCQAEYKPHVHESETSISCQFMRCLWIIQLWQPGTRNVRRGDRMGRMRELRQLIHLSYFVVYACVHEWEYVHLHVGASAAWDPVYMCVCACTDIVLTLC